MSRKLHKIHCKNMWATFLKVYQLLHNLMPQRVLYDPNTKRFIENPKISKLYWFVNWQATQAFVVAAVRMLTYLKSEPGKSGISFVDFAIDLLLWALTFLHTLCCWTFHYKRHHFCFVLNEYLIKRDLKGKEI